jgi:phospho-N-acetylmuramoyl-pentapeptide-transferase
MNNAPDFKFTLFFAVSFITALAVSAICVRLLIPYLVRKKTTQSIYELAPKTHRAKSDTPTMGGIGILAGLAAGTGAVMALTGFSLNLVVCYAVSFVFGIIGFADDITKVLKHRNLGLTASQKLVCQFVVSLLFALYFDLVANRGTEILIPFAWKWVDISWFIYPYIIFIIMAMVNSVNLTDGLDGLAGGVSFAVSGFYPVLTVASLTLGGTTYLSAAGGSVTVLRGDTNDAFFLAALSGACFGFLIFNRHPAKIFMGDTGSLAIGGGLAACAILLHTELLLPFAGFIFVAEALSDIIQVGSYKLRHGKRVFKMAPLHHHFELSGWKETKVVGVFIGATVIICLMLFAVMVIQQTV